MRNIKNRLHQLFTRCVMIGDVALRFAADSNIRSVNFLSVDSDPDYVASEEVRVEKVSGGYIVHRISTYNGSMTSHKAFCTHDLRQVKALIRYGLDIDREPVIYNQHSRPAKLAIVRFAEK